MSCTNLFSSGNFDRPSCDACLAFVRCHRHSCLLALSFDVLVMARPRSHRRLCYAQAMESCLDPGVSIPWLAKIMEQAQFSFADVTRANKNRESVTSHRGRCSICSARGLGMTQEMAPRMLLYDIGKPRKRQIRSHLTSFMAQAAFDSINHVAGCLYQERKRWMHSMICCNSHKH